MNGSKNAPLPNSCGMDRSAVLGADLVAAAKAGHPGAFSDLYATYSQRLYRTIVNITKSPEDAEDALQETFLKAYRAIHAFEGRSALSSWLTRIAINSALMVLRKRRANPEILFDPEPEAAVEAIGFDIKDTSLDPEQRYDVWQRRVVLLKAIHKLSPRLKEPMRMQLTEDLSVKDIGNSLELSEAVVKSRLHRARKRLSKAPGIGAFRNHVPADSRH